MLNVANIVGLVMPMARAENPWQRARWRNAVLMLTAALALSFFMNNLY